LDTIIDRLLQKSLLTALTSIGNNDRDEIDASEGEIVSNKNEVVNNEDVMVNDGDVIDDNISISLLNIKGIYSDETSFLLQLSFNFN